MTLPRGHFVRLSADTLSATRGRESTDSPWCGRTLFVYKAVRVSAPSRPEYGTGSTGVAVRVSEAVAAYWRFRAVPRTVVRARLAGRFSERRSGLSILGPVGDARSFANLRRVCARTVTGTHAGNTLEAVPRGPDEDRRPSSSCSSLVTSPGSPPAALSARVRRARRAVGGPYGASASARAGRFLPATTFPIGAPAAA